LRSVIYCDICQLTHLPAKKTNDDGLQVNQIYLFKICWSNKSLYPLANLFIFLPEYIFNTEEIVFEARRADFYLDKWKNAKSASVQMPLICLRYL